MKVNKERLSLWIEALESDEFQQGTGALKTLPRLDGSAKYCCLGVATEVAIANGLQLNNIDQEKIHEYNRSSGQELNPTDGKNLFEIERAFLPSSVIEWYGLTGGDPEVGRTPTGISVSATDANDRQCWTFTQIAAALRSTYGIGVKNG